MTTTWPPRLRTKSAPAMVDHACQGNFTTQPRERSSHVPGSLHGQLLQRTTDHGYDRPRPQVDVLFDRFHRGEDVEVDGLRDVILPAALGTEEESEKIPARPQRQ